MYKITNITQFEAHKIFDYLSDGSGSQDKIKSFLRLTDKLDDYGKRPVNEAIFDQTAFLKSLRDKYSEEQLQKFSSRDFDRERLKLWDEIFLEELLLENDEFKLIKDSCLAIDKKEGIQQVRERARRIDALLDRIKEAAPFDAKELLKSEKDRPKQEQEKTSQGTSSK